MVTNMENTRETERSWQLELISEINEFCDKNPSFAIKRAGGEITLVKTKSAVYLNNPDKYNKEFYLFGSKSDSMFPDLLLFGDRDRNAILQGWELKLPDVPITDITFITDGRRKAKVLNSNSYVLWNFKDVHFYVKGKDGNWNIEKTWNIKDINNRADVKTYRSKWEAVLLDVLKTINLYISTGRIKKSLIADVVTDSVFAEIVKENVSLVADKLKMSANSDAVMDADITQWWTRLEDDEYKTNIENKDQIEIKYNAYAKSILLNWINRIIFAQAIKYFHTGALEIENINQYTTIREANEIFQKITSKTDFWNIFKALPYNENIPPSTWANLIDLSMFLNDKKINQNALHMILERTVASSKRLINGQFTTPNELAKLLVRITVHDWTGHCLDCCCGTGTIARAIINDKKTKLSMEDTMKTTWASDKYQYPLQLANLSMADEKAINLPSQVFQHNGLNLVPNGQISVIDPQNGKQIHLTLPYMKAVVSNLPFIEFERIPLTDKSLVSRIGKKFSLNAKADLYCYLALHIADLLEDGGYAGLILSNAWMGTDVGKLFIKALEKVFALKQVHMVDHGRWFHNASVVTTILLLQKKSKNDKVSMPLFYLWHKSLKEFEKNPKYEQDLVLSSLLESDEYQDVVTVSKYNQEDYQQLKDLKLSLNVGFYKIEWLKRLKGKIVPLSSLFNILRGSRRGWNAMFQPPDKNIPVESEFIKPMLLRPKDLKGLYAEANGKAFCCKKSIDELKQGGYVKTLEWINLFANTKNGTGKPLPIVLKRSAKEHWYEMPERELTEFVTSMNPSERFFFARFKSPSFISQRFIGLNCHVDNSLDKDLYHALLNSILSTFFIEAIGFGRGLGVLDINSTNLQNVSMLNPALLNENQKNEIISAFKPLLGRDVLKTHEEIKCEDRIYFDHTVLSVYGIDDIYDDIVNTVLAMQQSRLSAKDDD